MSSRTFSFYFAFIDAVDAALQEGTDPLELATDPQWLIRWTSIPPAETWAEVLERAYFQAHYHPDAELPTDHQSTARELALALKKDARGVASYVDWQDPISPSPSQEVQLQMLVLLAVAVRRRFLSLN